ncbi:MAG: hypothetical protein IPJ97_04625 [Proteobacteria bacterium]|nr:hypothetical protein [Pseudomonadota bacterium]
MDDLFPSVRGRCREHDQQQRKSLATATVYQGSRYRRADRAPVLQVAMCQLHVTDRVGLADLDAHDAAPDHVEEFGG